MKLLDYMSKMAEVARTIDNCDRFDKFVDSIDSNIRNGLNLNRGRITLPDDWREVKDWLDGAPIHVLRDIDICEGGVFYYYLCRIGVC